MFWVPSYLANITTETDFLGWVYAQIQVLVVYIVDSNKFNPVIYNIFKVNKTSKSYYWNSW